MKNISYIIFIFVIFIYTNCEIGKIDTIDENDSIEIVDNTFIYGEWRLIKGQMFFENLDTDEKFYKRHFGNGREISSLRYSGIAYELEKIILNYTIWKFKKNNTFILNKKENTPYGLNISNSYISITENPLNDTVLLGGSARPIDIIEIDEQKMIIKISTIYENININGNYNFRYFNILIFEKID